MALQGLLDTDGWCCKDNGTIQYYSVSKQLTDDVKELGKVENMPKMEGRQMIMVLSPRSKKK